MLTRGELGDAMARGRAALRRAGLDAHARVAVLMPEGLPGAVTALQVAGACSVAPLRPSLGSAGWVPALAALAPTALVVSPEWAGVATAASELGITVLDPDQLGPAAPGHTETSTDNEELLLATSGSTGPPKWARIPQSRVAEGSRAMSRLMGLTPADRALLALPLHHALGMVSGLLLPLLSGGSVVVAEGFDAERFLIAIRQHSVTWFSVPPAMQRALVEQHARSPISGEHRLRLIRTGTISLPQNMLDALREVFDVPVIEAYGMTECPHITCNPPDSPRYGSVGRAVAEAVMVVDNAGRPVPPGEWGQVVVRGAPSMIGYVDPRRDPDALRGGWLQTGDEGRLDADGYLFLRGRISERINRGGAIVAPAAVDAALLAHPDVRSAAAFGVPHQSLGEDLAAAVVLAEDAGVDETHLLRYLAGRVEPREVPSALAVVSAIPVGATGKVMRSSLPQMLAGDLYRDFEAPRDPLEALLVGLFVEVLAQRIGADRKIGRLANFFLEGGDSLAAMQFMTAFARAGGGQHPPPLLYENPNPAALARALRAAPGGESHLVNLQSGGDGDPMVVVHGITGQLFAYLALARALGRRRPVYGLQAAGYSDEELSELDVGQLASRYAEEIIERLPGQYVHLVGYSAGGWVAHAVAAALRDRGVSIGVLGVLDSHCTRKSEIYAGLPLHTRSMLTVAKIGDKVGWRSAVTAGVRAEPSVRFKSMIQRYRPGRLPMTVDLFGPARTMARLKRTWRYYAGAVRCHPLFDQHTDMAWPDSAPRLADELERVIAAAEGSHHRGRSGQPVPRQA
jgi:acyl-CoA synthetase (AMP-forming)/AMP-acid ligase II/pimeloyl-ACP methyl ester carboxylesterase